MSKSYPVRRRKVTALWNRQKRLEEQGTFSRGTSNFKFARATVLGPCGVTTPRVRTT